MTTSHNGDVAHRYQSRGLHAWLDHNTGRRRASPFDHPAVLADVIDFPEILVTEEPATDAALRRFEAACQRKPLELIP